ncbi:dihydroneopterin aldolase [uncultured Gemella sp.]|uniref:dihydroneopterin aldolase n=1 Tax=uncultured Gemella sp. TaxID=254352 RepID=UPI0028D57FA5|nr:dihydroneopterin aldolase [uncultured Gemella sp.]
MKTVLFIDNLEVFANHGLFEEENKLGQKFIFDIECELNYKKAMFSDEMTDSISYADIAEVVVKTTTTNTFNLLERLAGEILKNIFTEFSQIENINLKINKPGAPIKYHFEKCGVEVKTSREEFYNL